MEILLEESGINRLHNTNFVARLFQLTGLGEVSDPRNIWTWSAIILAAIAAFSTVIRGTKLLILRSNKIRSVISHSSLLFSTDDDTCSSSDDDEEEEDEEEEELSCSDDDEPASGYGENQGQNGKMNLFGDVVRVWDGLGLGFEDLTGYISLLDLNRGESLRTFRASTGQIPVASIATPSVVLTASEATGEMAAVKVWDARDGGDAPSSSAEWQPRRRRTVVGIAGGEGKVYVHDDVGEISVVDLRNVRSPVGDTWWDGEGEVFENAVTGSERGGSAVVEWCRNAVRCFPVLPSSWN